MPSDRAGEPSRPPPGTAVDARNTVVSPGADADHGGAGFGTTANGPAPA